MCHLLRFLGQIFCFNCQDISMAPGKITNKIRLSKNKCVDCIECWQQIKNCIFGLAV